jgi:hypothetical protein
MDKIINPCFFVYSMKKEMKLCLLLICVFLFLFLKLENIAAQSISLTEDADNYTIENEYYKAVIPKESAPAAKGIIRWLYIKNSSGWSNNLIKENLSNYGLGYLEGTGEATANMAFGLQSDCTVSILENTSTKVKIISYNNSYYGVNYTEVWTFWAKKPYFRSEASAIIVNESGYLTNQFQFAWMINDDLTNIFYMINNTNDITQPSAYQMHQINSPNLTSYPWINWQFTNENVSLGLMFTDVYDYYGTFGEPLAASYEYQIDFELGSGLLDNPVKKDYKRELVTIYYTNSVTNNDIANFSREHYQNASTKTETNPVLQASQYLNNSMYQNPGLASALVNSPYFLVRQNSQNTHTSLSWQQYETSIYAPLYKSQETIHSDIYDFIDQLTYSLNYNNGTNTFIYGNITQAIVNNSDYETLLQMNATSNNNKLFYSSTFKAWNDSDKLKIVGYASNASENDSVKEIYVSLAVPSWGQNRYEAEIAARPSEDITATLNTTDSLWTNYNYAYDSGTTLIYRNELEDVPTLSVPLSIPDGEFDVIAYVQQRTEGNLTYKYSMDNVTWYNFTVKNGDSTTIIPVDLGLKNITNRIFYIDDDDALGGTAAWAGWDKLNFVYINNLSSDIYDIKLGDAIYGELGIAVKVNSPVNNISIINNSKIYIYLYQNDTAQNLTAFNYSFDIEIYPHKGWLNNSSEFTELHSRAILNYTKHIFYVPEGIHNGRINTIYSSGAVSYSTEPYEDSSEIDMTAIPSNGSLNVTIIDFTADYKKWNETASDSAATASHMIGNLKSTTNYSVEINGALWNTYISNSSGYISFIYNGGYSIKIFEIKETPSPTPSVGDYPTFVPSKNQMEEGYTKSLYKGWKIEFGFENKTYTIKLDDIINETAVITVGSNSQTFNLTVNETKKMDLNNDGFYDMQIFLENITSQKADLIIKFVYEKIPSETKTEEKEETAEKLSFLELFIFIISTVLVVVIIFVLIKIIKKISRKRKIRRKEEI